MNFRQKLFVALGVAAVAFVMTQVVAAQGPVAKADAGSALPRTAWGAPDLQGVWDFRTITPLQRPEDLADKAVLSAEEAAQYQRESLEAQNKDQRTEDGLSAERDVANAYNDFWWDYGNSIVEDRRTSLIVQPANGRIPALTPKAQAAAEARRNNGRGPADSWEDRSLWERCILGFNSGPPMFPSAYNNNVQLLQTPDSVVILNEMVHNSRIVPLGDRPHLDDSIRQWTGDSRGYWEGDTLVVETTNFLNDFQHTIYFAASPKLKLVERFSRLDADTLIYEFTIDDPETFVEPWTAIIPMRKNEFPLFEYACHEGNYGMTNLLAGHRAEEAEPAQGSSK